MNYEKLQTFITVAEKKSFSEAAKILYLSQPTITSQIKSLEKDLNTSLFDRTTKQVQLTAAAHVLYRYAKEIIKVSDTAKKEILSMSEQVHGDLEVACSLTIGENILPPILREFKAAYPFIQMRVNITNSASIIKKVKDHVLDIGLIEAPMEDPNLYIQPFMEDELVLVAPPDYFAEETKGIMLSEIASLPLVLRERGSGTRTVMNEYLQANNINPEQLKIEFELGSNEAVIAAVEAGLGLSILSKSAIKKELQFGLLQLITIEEITFKRNFYIVYHQEAVLKATTDVFLATLEGLAGKLSDEPAKKNDHKLIELGGILNGKSRITS
ncbi:selenium metabolism-associated LysR family transcriptional regulator [Thalassobacillus devorans]|uniref:selenium metabolism-associated LysR family transcriptional regulator n=1 Tax=Thalassobacillus devorans TaxID=279813 RepID=UPI000A1CB942|nr:selenium metabolism-associated LysR family transcriptional regulator [Thalassobacillus devorans]